MSRPLIRATLAMLALSSILAHSGQVIEGIAATVDGHVILTSEVDQAVEYQCLLKQTACDISSAELRKTALQRLIEQALVQEQMEQAPRAKDDREVAEKVVELRQSLLTAHNSDTEWARLLGKYDLSENEIAQRLQRELLITRYIDGRFRSTVRIDQEAIEQYYEQTLLPEVQKAGAPAPSLGSVEGKIREILIEQEIDSQFASWLEVLRQASKIEVR